MGYGRSMMVGMVAGLVVVALAVTALVFVVPSMRSPMSVPGDRVLLVVGSRSGADGSQVAHLIAVADLRGGGLGITLVDPMLKVAVPGTTFDRLRDAYPFGGGAGVSRAYASAAGGQPLPVVSVSESGLMALVDRAGGIEVSVPKATNVFDGKRMFTFEAGSQRLGGAEVVALLSSQEFQKTPEERAALSSAVADGMAKAASASPAAFSAAAADGRVTSTLEPAALAVLGSRLHTALPQARIEPFAR